MTDREFWRAIRRHMLGIAAAIMKRWPTEEDEIMEGYDIRWTYNEKQERIAELVKDK